MKRLLASGGEKAAARPSGHVLVRGAFGRDNGGAIPHNLLVAANTESNSSYISQCKQKGLPVHPARFPGALPQFFIKLCTDLNDLVYDPCAGSGVTAEQAELLGRRWIMSEVMREFIEGARLRFNNMQLALAA